MYRSRRIAARARRVSALVFWQPDPNTVHPDDIILTPDGHDALQAQPAPAVGTEAGVETEGGAVAPSRESRPTSVEPGFIGPADPTGS